MIEIWTEILPEGWRWTPYSYKGGTPEFYIETAECLSKLGNQVLVYYDGEPCEKDGVYYLPRDQFQGTDKVLACNDRPPYGNKTVFWTNKVGQKDTDYLDFNYRVTLSKYHQGIFGDSEIIGHGCWPIKSKEKKNQCLYSSSPDRGLEFLLKIWPDVHKETNYTLKVSYNRLWGQTEVKGVDFIGFCSDKEMNDLYAESKFWLHPCQGIELFCISGYKAQSAKCIPVVVPNMALAETVKYGIKTNLENYKKDLIKAIKNPPKVPQVKLETWMDQTIKLDKLLNK